MICSPGVVGWQSRIVRNSGGNLCLPVCFNHAVCVHYWAEISKNVVILYVNDFKYLQYYYSSMRLEEHSTVLGSLKCTVCPKNA